MKKLPDQALFRGGASGQASGHAAQTVSHDGGNDDRQLCVYKRASKNRLRGGLRLSGRSGAAPDAH